MNKWPNFNFPVSYNVNAQNRMRDARNVFSKEDILKTRNGIVRFNDISVDATSEVKSISYYENSDSDKFILGMSDTTLYNIKPTGVSPAIKAGLTSNNRHRSINFSDRAIVAIGTDGLFSFDGTIFTQLGEDPPNAPVVAKSGGGTLPASDYQVAITFYSENLGFETNIGTASSSVTVNGTEQIDVTAIPTTPINAHMNKKRVYVKDVGNAGAWFFWEELDLVTTVSTINSEILSTITPPTKNARPVNGGGKFLAAFGDKMAYAGSSEFPEEVFLSEEYLPDAFDSTATRRVIKGIGEGAITGIGVGLYDSDNLDPYLCIFKKRSVQVYSEIGGLPSLSIVSTKIGCVSHDTIQEVEGDIYFQSAEGWHRIVNGRVEKDNKKPFRLGGTDMDSIYTQSGYVYELNQVDSANFHSVYYAKLQHYMTFISEGAGVSKNKCYNFEFDIKGFRPLEFPISFSASCTYEDATGKEVVLLAGPEGRLYKYSIDNDITDVDKDNVPVDVAAFAQLYWLAHEDIDATMNFGTLHFRALSNDTPIEVRCFYDYELGDPNVKEYDFSKDETGFILDVSFLDQGILGDGRTIARGLGFVGRSSQAMLLGFYKTATNESMDLIMGQIDTSKNGNPN